MRSQYSNLWSFVPWPVQVAAFVATVFASLSYSLDGNSLLSAAVEQSAGNGVEIHLTFSGPAPEPLSFTVDKPARIALDLPNTSLALPDRRMDVRAAGVETVVFAQANGRTRMVISTDDVMPYNIRVDGRDIFVSIGPTPLRSASGTSTATGTVAERTPGVRDLDFRRLADGTFRLVVQLTDPELLITFRHDDEYVGVDLPVGSVPKDLLRRYEVLDFETPVQVVDVFRIDGGNRIRITADGPYCVKDSRVAGEYYLDVQAFTPIAGDPRSHDNCLVEHGAGKITPVPEEPVSEGPISAIPTASVTEPPTYRVKRGDSLSGIAERFLHNGSLWRNLLALNPQITDPQKIYPGDLLRLAENTPERPQIVVKGSGATEVRVPVSDYVYAGKLPPAGYGGYGYLVFTKRPSKKSAERYLATCKAFFENLYLASEYKDVPKSDLLPTFWLRKTQQTLGAMPRNCPTLVSEDNYDWERASKLVSTVNKLDVEGPILVAWTTPQVVPGSEALLFDLSGFDDVDLPRAFGIWRAALAKEPGHWRGGFDVIVLREALRNFIDKYGDSIVQVVKSNYGTDKQPTER
jgi:LysM repeat protein